MHATERRSAHGDAKRNNPSGARLWSIAQGARIEWLPTRLPGLGDPPIPLDSNVKFRFDVQYPRFGDEFVHEKVSQPKLIRFPNRTNGSTR